MQTFGERIGAARSAKGMTQEALASALNVTRQTISSWERGRTIPDIDMVRRLSEVLGVDLAQADASPAPAADASPEASEAKPARPGRRRWIIVGAAALVCAALALFLTLNRKPAMPDGENGFDAAVYTQAVPNDAGKAYLAFESRTWTENNGGSDYQRYDFTMTEINGIGFTIARVDVRLESKTGAVRDQSFAGADIPTDIEIGIPPFGRSTIDGGFPLGEFTRVGIAVYGTDANGAPMTFYTLIEF